MIAMSTMTRPHPTVLTVRFHRRPGTEHARGGITSAEYDIAWPDGRPVQTGLNRFCRRGRHDYRHSCHSSDSQGGLFFFDLNTKHKYVTTSCGQFAMVEDDSVVRAGYDPATRIARFDATMFEKDRPAFRS